jgi:hypothetical protein
LFNKQIRLYVCPKLCCFYIHTARINAGVALGVLDSFSALSTTDRVVESCLAQQYGLVSMPLPLQRRASRDGRLTLTWQPSLRNLIGKIQLRARPKMRDMSQPD